MSIIHINQIKEKIKSLFESHLDLSDLSRSDSEIEAKILTRCLAAYGVYNSIGCSIEDAAASVVDGGDDNGVDAIFYSPQHKQMILVQSKWNKTGRGEPDSADISKFAKGVKDLFEMNFDRFNSKVQSKQEIITKALNEYETKYKIILIDTSEKTDLAKHASRHIDDLIEEMNSTGDDNADQIVTYDRLNQGKVFSSFALSMGTEPIKIELGLSEWGIINEPHKAYYGIVSALEIAQWWKDYERQLFDKNIRQVLGSTEVNEEMEETINQQPENFWYFNNGITIIADDIQKTMVGGNNRDIGTFKLSNISIVNGAQTVSTIGKYSTKENANLNNVKVQVRVIALRDTPEGFGKEITRTNNRQNRIENRDFISQEPEQHRIRTELAIEEIEYNIVRSDLFRASEKAFDLQEATVALACASGQSSLAVLAKGSIGKFYENIEGRNYKSLFNPQTSGLYIFHTVLVNRKINEILQTKIAALKKRSGRHYGLHIHGNRIITLLVIKNLNLTQSMQKIDFELNSQQLEECTTTTIQKVFTFLEEKYPENILGTLFKNASKCADIVNNCI